MSVPIARYFSIGPAPGVVEHVDEDRPHQRRNILLASDDFQSAERALDLGTVWIARAADEDRVVPQQDGADLRCGHLPQQRHLRPAGQVNGPLAQVPGQSPLGGIHRLRVRPHLHLYRIAIHAP